MAILSQVLNGILLPVVLLFMLLLVNKSHLMGKDANPRLYNIVAWTLTAIITVLTIVMLVLQ